MQGGALAQLQKRIDEGAPFALGLAVAPPVGVEGRHRLVAVHGPKTPDLAELPVGQVVGRWCLSQTPDQGLAALRQLAGDAAQGKGTVEHGPQQAPG